MEIKVCELALFPHLVNISAQLHKIHALKDHLKEGADIFSADGTLVLSLPSLETPNIWTRGRRLESILMFLTLKAELPYNMWQCAPIRWKWLLCIRNGSDAEVWG
ncbi:uncharacterized protein [Misgurnus anguillicaudatus]|uniref:uncharacterized protein isoform X2 n=1 Tax=Misgurnus anguillicaudatus TaxID=75329 RepID=UPI003CCF4D48